MPGDGGPNLAAIPLNFAANDSVIDLVHAAPGELRRECYVGFISLGHDKAAAGLLIKAVNDSRPSDPADAAELPFAMVEQCVYKRVFLVTGGGMHHQPRRLVEHEQRVILMQDVERDFFGLGIRRARFGPVNFHLFSGPWRMRRLDRLSVNLDMPLFNQAFDRAP